MNLTNTTKYSKERILNIVLGMLSVVSIIAFLTAANAAETEKVAHADTLKDWKVSTDLAITMTNKVIELTEAKSKQNVLAILTEKEVKTEVRK